MEPRSSTVLNLSRCTDQDKQLEPFHILLPPQSLNLRLANMKPLINIHRLYSLWTLYLLSATALPVRTVEHAYVKSATQRLMPTFVGAGMSGGFLVGSQISAAVPPVAPVVIPASIAAGGVIGGGIASGAGQVIGSAQRSKSRLFLSTLTFHFLFRIDLVSSSISHPDVFLYANR